MPIANNNGQKIEFYFTDQPGNNPNIKSTEYVEPGTFLPLQVIETYDVFGTDDIEGGLAG